MKTKLLYLLLLICSYAYGQLPTNGLIAEYNLSNGALTDAVNGVNFTQSGTLLSTINDAFGIANSAISLNGDYLTRSDVNYPSGKGSISFWIKTSTSNNEVKTILDDTNGRTLPTDNHNWSGYYFSLVNGKIAFTIQQIYQASAIGRVGEKKVSSAVIADGNWHNITTTVDYYRVSTGQYRNGRLIYSYSTTAKLYVDGVLDQTITFRKGSEYGFLSNGNWSNSGNVVIANNRNNNLAANNRYNDAIDEVLFYGRVLSQSEVEDIATFNRNCIIDPANTALTISSITNTSANIDVSGSDTYNIAYHKTSEAFSNATIITGVTSGATNISSLNDDTDYNVYLRKQCTSSVSNWLDPISFKTNKTYTKVYVNKSATGNNDGTSWANAYTDLQNALATTTSNDEFWVAKGTYKPHASDRDASFAVKNNIYGGFAGTETTLADRDMSLIHTTNATILSGDLSGNDDATVDFNDATRTDNSKHVVEIPLNDVIIDGFSIQDGYADATNGDNRFGGGIFKSISVANLTVKNSKIKNNVALFGAGVSASSNVNSNVIIDACSFENNIANIAAGIDYHFSGTNGNLNITITNSLFNNNKTADDTSKSRSGSGAAAIRLRAYFNNVTINANIINNTFVNNSSLGTASNAGNYPVIDISKNSGNFGDFTVANNIFWGNTTNNGQLTKAIGKSNSSASSLSATDNPNIINNTDEDGFSTLSTTTNTITTNPNLDASFKLTLGSTAIDSGDNSYVTTSKDLLNNARIFNSTVDRGAFESGNFITRILTLTATNGTVATNPNPTNGTYADGTLVTLTATPNAGYGFVNWSGDVSGTTNTTTVTMNGDKTIAANFSATASVKDVDKINVLVHPNPMSNFLTIQLDEKIKIGKIIDVTGKEIKKFNSNKIDTYDISSGIYILKIETESGKIAMKKIIKK